MAVPLTPGMKFFETREMELAVWLRYKGNKFVGVTTFPSCHTGNFFCVYLFDEPNRKDIEEFRKTKPVGDVRRLFDLYKELDRESRTVIRAAYIQKELNSGGGPEQNGNGKKPDLAQSCTLSGSRTD